MGEFFGLRREVLGDLRREREYMALDDSDELEERLIDFAVRIGGLVETLPKSRLGKHIANQLVRSGTSAAPNYGEAAGAESRKDFIHKLGICLKELRETRVWIKMIIKAKMHDENKLKELLDECNQLNNIIAQSIITARKNRNSNS